MDTQNRPQIESDGKVTIHNHDTGATRRAWPIDAREVVERQNSPWHWYPAQPNTTPSATPKALPPAEPSATPVVTERAPSARGKPWTPKNG